MFTKNKKIQNVNNLATENEIQKNRRTTKKNYRIKQKKKINYAILIQIKNKQNFEL